jgi:hypothetical protein
MLNRFHMSLLATLPITLLYGLSTRFLFQSDMSGAWLGTLTLGLVVIGPLAIGALTVLFAPQRYKTSWVYALLMPWVACLVLVGVILWLAWEAWICVVMAAPFLLGMSSIGGAICCYILRRRQVSRDLNNVILAFFVLSPYLTATVEHRFVLPTSIRTVQNQIVIDANTATIWQDIMRVARIGEAEQQVRFYQLAGLPRPLEATLSRQDVGGVRAAIYENGLRFTEEIIAWEEQRSLTFTIVPDTSLVGPSSLPLKEIGGHYYSPIEATYTIEPLSDGKVLLHLSSKHRLSTRFNAYGGLWIDFIMSDLQSDILRIVKARAEAQAGI